MTDLLDRDSLTLPQLSRRGFAIATLAAGFALAVRPVAAGTITTDAEGLDAGEVSIPVRDGKIPGYRARPKGGHGEPVVLVVQEIFGVHEHIRDLCRRLAKRGYYAVAASLYARQGDPGQYTDIQKMVDEVVTKVPDDQVMQDLDETAAFAKSEGADAGRLAVTGFCWGGRIVWLYAAHSPAVKAGVAWYGGLVQRPGSEPSPLRPRQPIDLVAELKAPVLGLYAGKDQGITQEAVEQMRAALKAANSPCEIVVYADADHGFNADYRPTYNEAAAKDGWARMLAWFKDHGVG